eukprot:1142872-Pelagomonas_calceolata.AAC.3
MKGCSEQVAQVAVWADGLITALLALLILSRSLCPGVTARLPMHDLFKRFIWIIKSVSKITSTRGADGVRENLMKLMDKTPENHLKSQGLPRLGYLATLSPVRLENRQLGMEHTAHPVLL